MMGLKARMESSWKGTGQIATLGLVVRFLQKGCLVGCKGSKDGVQS